MSDAIVTHFPGFDPFRIETSEASIHGLKAGSGPAVLLLHGWPQTLLEWRVLAPQLARHFSVVITDLRGYGDSSKPDAGADHAGYSKRASARDQLEVMRALGHTRFAVVGHDRGGRVAHRMALDHASVVTRAAVLDIVPTLKVYSSVNKALASAYFHWFFLIQPAPLPETLIGQSSEFFLRAILGSAPAGVIPEPIFAEYLRAFRVPATLHAMCEDYRAGASIDLEHDRADLSSSVRCPLLTLWGERGAMHALYDVAATWRERASDVRHKALPGGHWLPEECPAELLSALLPFLSE
jgi:haloacetate dehalogenase